MASARRFGPYCSSWNDPCDEGGSVPSSVLVPGISIWLGGGSTSSCRADTCENSRVCSAAHYSTQLMSVLSWQADVDVVAGGLGCEFPVPGWQEPQDGIGTGTGRGRDGHTLRSPIAESFSRISLTVYSTDMYT